jgi:dTDP-glucose 4,6-dehydratase
MEYNTRFLIYGSRGWIGTQFVKLLNEKFPQISYIQGNSRCDNCIDLQKEIDAIKPTHVISFIGRTHGKINDKSYSTIDYLEQPGKLKENVRDNLFSPISLAFLCKMKNIHYTYLGTGCIFSYDEEHPFGKEINGFKESSLPNFTGSSYSTVKGYTDRMMYFFKDSVLNLRIRMPISETMNPRNFITKITTYEKICSIPNSMTVLPELLPIVVDMMLNKVTDTINLTNPGLISDNEILQMFKEIVDPEITWKYIPKPKKENLKKGTMLEEIKFNSENIDTLLVTGGCGFIGSNFINYFCEKYPNVKVVNIDALYYCANERNVNETIRNSENYVFVKSNLQNFFSLKHIFNNHNITHVIHFAAQSHVQNSFNESIQYTNDNVLGSHNLFEAIRLYATNIKTVIHVSTDEVYGESQHGNSESEKTEQSILCPTNPYAATKAAAELIAQSYIHSFKLPIIITRGNNVYGPNHYEEKVIPLFIHQLLKNKKITIQGDGSCIHAFLHSSDVCSAFESILFNGTIGEIYNIGCDQEAEISILKLGKLLIHIIKKNTNYNSYIEYIEDRPFNDKRYFISNQKLKDLGWTIKKDFLEGIKELIENIKTKINNENNKNNEYIIEYFSELI